MFTVDRIARLLTLRGLPPMKNGYLVATGTLDPANNINTHNPYPGHAIMDCLDKASGIETFGTLGERVTRHEEELTWKRLLKFF